MTDLKQTKPWIRKAMLTIEDLLYWLFFALALSLAPLGYTVWKSYSSSEKDLEEIIQHVISRGELLLVCVCLLGAVIGDLIRLNTEAKISRATIGGSSVILFFIASNAFADIASTSTQSIDFVSGTSWGIFQGTLGVALGAMLLPRNS